MITFRTLFIASLLLWHLCLHGQLHPVDWEVSMASSAVSGDRVPFWLMSNRQGRVFPEGSAAALEAGMFSQPDTARKVDPEYGAAVFGRVGTSDDVWIHQAYGGVRLYNLVRIRAGLWEEVVGSREPSLSSGSVIWSGHARPMPKVAIGTPGYITVPFTRGMAEIKGVLSHGWFEEGRYASDVWLHHKNAYIRLGGDLPVNVYYGLNHYVQWGGSSPRHEEPYPSDFDAFLRVFFIRSASPSDPGSPPGWVENKIGNHIASRNHGVDFSGDGWRGGLYMQDFIDDGSGWRRRNFPDGLWGGFVRFTGRERLVQAFLYEYLQSTDQSGPLHDLDGVVLGGNDNYFNHGHYRSGWSYHGYTIGTPLITSPILNDPPTYRFMNNRVRAHHVGTKGYAGGLFAYRLLFTYSRNYGRHSIPFDERRDHFGWMMELTRQLDFFGLSAGVTVAVDRGDMYGNNFGAMLQLTRRGVL